MTRLCLALAQHSRVRFVGLCHQIHEGYRLVSEAIGIPTEEIQLLAAGLNHFTWILAMAHRQTGEDLYPVLREKLKHAYAGFDPLSREMFDIFGLFPTGGGQHIGEYIGDAWRHVGTDGYDWG
jgi:alpha-galactosidase